MPRSKSASHSPDTAEARWKMPSKASSSSTRGAGRPCATAASLIRRALCSVIPIQPVTEVSLSPGLTP